MFKIFLSFMISLFVTNMALAGSNAAEHAAEFQMNHGSGLAKNELGKQVFQNQERDLKVTYDFTKLGGAVGTYKLPFYATAGSTGEPSRTLPKGAIITGCYIDVLTAGTTSASGTIALSTGQGAGDLKAATAAASYTGIVACIPVGSAATVIKLTADSVPTATIATGAITAGKFNLHIQYMLSD